MSHPPAWPPQNHVPPTSSSNKDMQWTHNPLLSPRWDVGRPGWWGLRTDTVPGLRPDGGAQPQEKVPHRKEPRAQRLRQLLPQVGRGFSAFPTAPLPQKYGWHRAGCWGPPSPAACLSSFLRSSRSTSHWRSELKPGSLHKPHTEQKWCGICLAQVGSGWPRAAWEAGISQ